MQIRRSTERGGADFGWLNSKHTFSFGDYHDPNFMGFATLRVINEDRVQPGKGFPTHAHSDMEIISYVLDGSLEHRDSLGNGSVIRPGDVQRMSAGTGIRHSEFNPDVGKLVHFLQIWIIPERDGMAPGYEQKHFSVEERSGGLRLVGSHDGRAGSVTIHQDVDLYAALLTRGQRVSHAVIAPRRIWLQVARGEVSIAGQRLGAGDGVAISDAGTVSIEALANAEVLLFDMADVG
jgi:redox-sensitive bicupin YhaK (pirin superfamily)